MNTPDQISSFLTQARAAQTNFLAALVQCPSDNPPGDCAAHAEHTAKLLEAMGLEVERHIVPKAQVQANGMISATNLVVRHHFGAGGPVIALNAHGDVVPPGEGWKQAPYGADIVDGWMYGRGVAVSKSDFATYAFALLALQKSTLELRGTVELHLTYDEEVGGEIGPGFLLQEGISKPDLAIAAGFSYAVVNAHNGCLHLEVQVEGRSAHAAMPFTGVDALQAANSVLSALYAERTALTNIVSNIKGIGSPQLTVGLISGGINTNVVPDRVTLRLDRRIIPEENPQAVEADLNTLITRAVSHVAGARVNIRQVLLAEPLTPLPGADVLVKALCTHASQIMGEEISTTGVPLYTDARHYAASGVPIVLFGAGPHTIEEANAHRADERLKLDDLYKATEVVTRALADLLSHTTSPAA